MKRLTPFAICFALFLVPAWADMSFWQEAKITGGMMQGAMKMAGVFSKRAREPMVTEVVKHGNRVSRISNQKATITDLDARTVTEVDYKRKRYSSYTFEQMRQYMKQMEEKVKKQAKNREMEFKFTVEVDELDETREFDGKQAKGYQVRVTVDSSGAQGQQPAGMLDMTMKTFMTELVDGYEEYMEFERRVAEEMWLPNATMGGMVNVQPGASQSMAQLFAEVSKLDGMPVFQTATMGGTQTPPPQEGAAAAPPPEQEEQEDQSIGGAMKKGLGGLGGFGGFGRKKKKKKEQETTAQPPQQSGAFMEMEFRFYNHSNAPVDPAKVDTEPAGFKRVKSDIEKALK